MIDAFSDLNGVFNFLQPLDPAVKLVGGFLHRLDVAQRGVVSSYQHLSSP